MGICIRVLWKHLCKCLCKMWDSSLLCNIYIWGKKTWWSKLLPWSVTSSPACISHPHAPWIPTSSNKPRIVAQRQRCTAAVPNRRLFPDHVFDKYFSNWSWEKQMSKVYMSESKALYHKKWRWPFLRTPDWLTNHCETYQQLCTSVHLNLASPEYLKNQNTHTSQQMASPYKVSGAWGLSQHCQTDQMSVWESGGNGKEGQRQTYHLFWSHGKWGISRGWRWAINKVMSVKGGGSLNYRPHWVNYSVTHGKYWCPISLWTTYYRSGPTFQFLFFFKKHVHATPKMWD